MSAVSNDDDKDSDDEHDDVSHVSASGSFLPAQQIDGFSGRRPKKQGKEFNKPSVMHFPESLTLSQPDHQHPPTTAQIIDLVKKAVDHPDVQTTFFINFSPGNLDARGTEALKRTIDMTQVWQAWSSSVCEGNLQQQIDNRRISATEDGQFVRSTHRAKVLDYLFRQSPWFAKIFDENMTRHIEVQKEDFHAAIFKSVLDGFQIPVAAYATLEKILTTIGDNVTLAETKTQEKHQYWLMLTRYDWTAQTQTTQTAIRTISISIDSKMSDFTKSKSQVKSISIDLQFRLYQADLVEHIWRKVKKDIDQSLIQAGMDLVTQKTIEVPI